MFRREDPFERAAQNAERLAQNGTHITYDDAPPPYQEHENREASNIQPRADQSTREEQEAERVRLINQYLQITNQLYAETNPRNQFCTQRNEEAERMAEKKGKTPRDWVSDAGEVVEARWRAQGIWSPSWHAYSLPGYRWPHEYVLKREPFSDSEDEREYQFSQRESRRVFNSIYEPQRYRTKQQRHESERRRLARMAKRAHTQSLSRPLQQFTAQVADECCRLIEAHEQRNELNHQNLPRLLDINTMAYEVVKARWKKNDIWRPYWSVLPGPEWQHELPLRMLVIEKMGAENLAKLPPEYSNPGPSRPRVLSPEPEPALEPEPEPIVFPTSNIFSRSLFSCPVPKNEADTLEERGEGSRSQTHNNEGEGGENKTESNQDRQKVVDSVNNSSEPVSDLDDHPPDADAETRGEDEAAGVEVGLCHEYMGNQALHGNAAPDAPASARRDGRLQGIEYCLYDHTHHRVKRPRHPARAKPPTTQGISRVSKKKTDRRTKRR